MVFKPEDNSKIAIMDWFMKAIKNNWEANTFSAMMIASDPDKVAIDIGAWIGPMSIWMSKNFRRVIAIEPDIVALEALRKNLASSECHNVEIINQPIYSSNTELYFGACSHEPKYANSPLGGSISHIKESAVSTEDYKVESLVVKDLKYYCDFSKVAFVKVDIEGGEEDILEDLVIYAEKYNWKMWIEFHIDWWKNKDVARFTHLFDNAKHIGYIQPNNKVSSAELVANLSKNPFVSIYTEF